MSSLQVEARAGYASATVTHCGRKTRKRKEVILPWEGFNVLWRRDKGRSPTLAVWNPYYGSQGRAAKPVHPPAGGLGLPSHKAPRWVRLDVTCATHFGCSGCIPCVSCSSCGYHFVGHRRRRPCLGRRIELRCARKPGHQFKAATYEREVVRGALAFALSRFSSAGILEILSDVLVSAVGFA